MQFASSVQIVTTNLWKALRISIYIPKMTMVYSYGEQRLLRDIEAQGKCNVTMETILSNVHEKIDLMLLNRPLRLILDHNMTSYERLALAPVRRSVVLLCAPDLGAEPRLGGGFAGAAGCKTRQRSM